MLFDYVIVGAGPAGCILANRLTENGCHTVCLIEAGPPDRNPYIHIPAGFIKVGHDPRYTWNFETEPSKGSGGRKVTTRMGRTLGGSSSINGFNYTRGIPSDYDGWAATTCSDWSYEKILPYFKKSEQRIGQCDPKVHGQHGELPITDCDWRHPLCDAFIVGAKEFGLDSHVDYNSGVQEGAGYYHRWIKNGRRYSAARAFLEPAKTRPNLTILTNTQVISIAFEGKRATGVTVQSVKTGTQQLVKAKIEVILSAGAANTPKLLQLSGIGPAQYLQHLGIPVLHDSPGVGENFHDHFMVRSVVRVKQVETINSTARGWRLLREIARWARGRPSVLAISPSVAFAFTKSSPNIQNADLQFHFSPGSYASGIAGKLDSFPGMTLGFYHTRPISKGFVRARSKDPFELPSIQPNYIEHDEDQAIVIRGLKQARAMLHSRALTPYIDSDDFPPAYAQTDEELLDCARQRGGTAWHFMGTCKMGQHTDIMAVVDPELRVRGILNLRVVDASIMPTMPSGNTGAPTMMIAEKAADMILAAVKQI